MIGATGDILKSPFEASPGYEDSFVRKFSEATGSVGPFLALGPFGVPGLVAAGGLGVAAGAGEARTRAEEAGATPEQIETATQFGAGVGVSEVLPVAKFARAIKAATINRNAQRTGAGEIITETGDDLSDIITRGRRILGTAGAEGVQEFSAAVAQNLIAKGIYDPEQGVFTNTGEDFGYGAGVGGLVQGITDIILNRRQRRAKAPGDSQDAPDEGPSPADLINAATTDLPPTLPPAGDADIAPESVPDGVATVPPTVGQGQDPDGLQSDLDILGGKGTSETPSGKSLGFTDIKFTEQSSDVSASFVPEVSARFGDMSVGRDGNSVNFAFDTPLQAGDLSILGMSINNNRTWFNAQSANSGEIRVSLDNDAIEIDAPSRGKFARIFRQNGSDLNSPDERQIRRTLGDSVVDSFFSADPSSVQSTLTQQITGRDLTPQIKGISDLFTNKYASAGNTGGAPSVGTPPPPPPSTGLNTPFGIPEGTILQNRGRSSPASIKQMNNIANKPVYGRIAFSNSFTDGAPVVFGQEQLPANQIGRSGNIFASNSDKTFGIQYGVIEADQIRASNKVDGSTVSEYSDPSVGGFRAINNGRVAGLKKVYRGNMGKYKQDLINDNMHALTPM